MDGGRLSYKQTHCDSTTSTYTFGAAIAHHTHRKKFTSRYTDEITISSARERKFSAAAPAMGASKICAEPLSRGVNIKARGNFETGGTPPQSPPRRVRARVPPVQCSAGPRAIGAIKCVRADHDQGRRRQRRGVGAGQRRRGACWALGRATSAGSPTALRPPREQSATATDTRRRRRKKRKKKKKRKLQSRRCLGRRCCCCCCSARRRPGRPLRF